MNFRGAIKSIFGKPKQLVTSSWQEVGSYQSYFTGYNSDLYANEVVRACIRTLAEHTSKANVKVLRDGKAGDQKLQRMIQYRPNFYMNGKDFLYKVRTRLEIDNVVFIYVMRDEIDRVIGLYPMPRATHQAKQFNGRLFIEFQFDNGTKMIHAWDDLAVLRKDYNTSDIFGDSNSSISSSLELLNTTNEGMANAIKSTANLRGILQSKKAMLTDDDVKKMKDRFTSDYLDIANTSGIAAMDSMVDFIPVQLQPHIANYKNVEELRNNIYRYFGVNEDAIMSRISGDSWEAFYESRIEPVLLALGLELTNKIFTAREQGFNNEIVFESNRMQYMSTTNKLALVQMVDRGALTANEWREVMNMAPIAGGDVPQFWQNPKGESDNASETE